MTDELNQTSERPPDTVQMPAPTAWPIALAFGITLLFAGLVTSEAVSALGGIVALVAAIGWFRDVLPHESHESVLAAREIPAVLTTRREVHRLVVAPELRRA